MTSDSPHLRFAVVGIVTISLFAALFARLWFLQVMTSPQYEIAARNNAIRDVQEEAPRGRILDRQSRILVDNRRMIQVSVDWQAYNKLRQPEQNALLGRLAATLTRFANQAATGVSSIAPLGATDPAAGVTITSPSDSTTTPTSEGAVGSVGPAGSGGLAEPSTTTEPGPEAAIPPAPPPEPVTVAKLRKRLSDERFSHFKPVPVATDVGPALQIFLVEHAADYPTVAAERVTVRQYHYGTLLSHVLGYVGQANTEDLKQFANKAKPYELSDEVGKAGIERSMEAQLRGTPGVIRYEVDARNRPVREVSSRPPVPGNDVYLSVDIDLQYVVEKALAAQIARLGKPGACTRAGCPQSRTGAAVVTDPRNGQVLAMASYPTYDPNLFTGGISTADYAALKAEANGKPAFNRAISGQYAPGSTWKLFTAYSGLANQQITPDTAVDDRGSYAVPDCEGTKRQCNPQNAGGVKHGTVRLSSAITVSSDVYFYKLGDDMWRRRGQIGDDALAKTYSEWGFGKRTGVGLVGEQPGRIPSPEQKRQLAEALHMGDQQAIDENARWGSGDNMNTAIGQGDVLVTPLQLANGYATFADGGTLYEPQLVVQVIKGFSESVVSITKPAVVRKINMPLEWQLPLAAGFAGVTRSGTARETFAGFPQDVFPVAGKTGTAQVRNSDGSDKLDTSLFVAYAPANSPRFAVAVILPEAGNGGDAAAPAVAGILRPLADVGGDMAQLPPVPEGGRFDPNSPDVVVAPPSGGSD